MKTEHYAHMTDQQLLNQFYIDHDNGWLGILLQRYTLLLFGVSMKYLRNEEEAKDAVQQVFLKSITELHKYRVEYFKSWLYMVAKNHCLMKLREKQGKTIDDIDIESTIAEADAAGLEEHIEKDRQFEFMNDCLEELNQEQKQCIILFYLDKYSYQQIAEKTGYSIMQVKSYIQNGKRNLRILLERKIRSANSV